MTVRLPSRSSAFGLSKCVISYIESSRCTEGPKNDTPTASRETDLLNSFVDHCNFGGICSAVPATRSNCILYRVVSLAQSRRADGYQEVGVRIRARSDQTVAVTGYADVLGSREANNLLSGLRAQVVMDQLVADGIPATRLRRVEQGATPDSGIPTESAELSLLFPRAHRRLWLNLMLTYPPTLSTTV